MVVRWSASEVGLAVAPWVGRLTSSVRSRMVVMAVWLIGPPGSKIARGLKVVIGHGDGGAPNGMG